MGFAITKDGEGSVEVPAGTPLESLCAIVYTSSAAVNCATSDDPVCDPEEAGLLEPIVVAAFAAGGVAVGGGSASPGG